MNELRTQFMYIFAIDLGYRPLERISPTTAHDYKYNPIKLLVFAVHTSILFVQLFTHVIFIREINLPANRLTIGHTHTHHRSRFGSLDTRISILLNALHGKHADAGTFR